MFVVAIDPAPRKPWHGASDRLGRLSGEDVEIRLSLTPKRDFRIERVTARLSAWEEVVSSLGTQRVTLRHELVDTEIPLPAPTRAIAGRPVRVEGGVPIPSEAPPTFRAPLNDLRWQIEIRIESAGSPDWRETKELFVKP